MNQLGRRRWSDWRPAGRWFLLPAGLLVLGVAIALYALAAGARSLLWVPPLLIAAAGGVATILWMRRALNR